MGRTAATRRKHRPGVQRAELEGFSQRFGVWGQEQRQRTGKASLLGGGTSYPKVRAMMVMRNPKNASSFRKPAGVTNPERSAEAEEPNRGFSLRVKGEITVFVQEEEDEGVGDGDEDAAPERDPAGTGENQNSHNTSSSEPQIPLDFSDFSVDGAAVARGCLV